jgi:hypothetical protein
VKSKRTAWERERLTVGKIIKERRRSIGNILIGKIKRARKK